MLGTHSKLCSGQMLRICDISALGLITIIEQAMFSYTIVMKSLA